MGILALGTVRISRLPGCSLKTDQVMKKLGWGMDDYRTEVETNTVEPLITDTLINEHLQ
jgi:hypothetical protein